jgi:DNA (cytosine-5)-methyltransferase 1
MNYYNDNERFVAQWLRNLIDAKQIAAGTVDERSIGDIKPNELAGFTRCHFFAGIAGWELALNLAGWPTDRPVWTGSCPCQPFSAAGKRKGGHDARNLWPVWFELIRVCRPPAIFGEQVEAAIGMGWLDRVFDDLEAEGYQTWACVLPACSVGAPHIRSRLFWMAQSVRSGTGNNIGKIGDEGRGALDAGAESIRQAHRTIGASGIEPRGASDRRMENATRKRSSSVQIERESRSTETDSISTSGTGCEKFTPPCEFGGMGDSDTTDRWRKEQERQQEGRTAARGSGAWSDSEYLYCSDGKWRRTQCGVCPLAPRIPGRVGQLRAYGNAIVPQVAAEFIKAIMSVAFDKCRAQLRANSQEDTDGTDDRHPYLSRLFV